MRICVMRSPYSTGMFGICIRSATTWIGIGYWQMLGILAPFCVTLTFVLLRSVIFLCFTVVLLRFCTFLSSNVFTMSNPLDINPEVDEAKDTISPKKRNLQGKVSNIF